MLIFSLISAMTDQTLQVMKAKSKQTPKPEELLEANKKL